MTDIQIEPELYVFDLPDGVRFVLARGVDAGEITDALLAAEVDTR